MHRIRDIDSIASEARNYDITIVFDRHLKDAINIRSGCTFGRIAYTPTDIIRMECIEILKGMKDEGLAEFIPDDYSLPNIRDICIVIADRTEYDLSYVFGEVRNIRNIRRYHDDASPYLCDPEQEGSKRVLEEYMKMPVLDRLMQYYSKFGKILQDKDVAVIGKRYMSLQEKQMIPEDAHEIDIFTDSAYIPDKITLFRNNAALAKNVASLITRGNSRDTAIVVGRPEIRNALIAEISRSSKIAVDSRESMMDLRSVGNYLEFLNTSKSLTFLRQKDVIELFRIYGVIIPKQYGNRYLSRYVEKDDKDVSEAKVLYDLMVNRDMYTFGEISKRLHDISRLKGHGFESDEYERMKTARKEVDDFLRKAGFYDRNATRLNLQYLYDIVNEEDISAGKRDGLIICSPFDTFIDRKNVIFIGLDSDWTRNLSEIRYIEDKKEEDDLNAERFSILIQQGKNRICMSTFTEFGRSTVPCNYFSPIKTNDSTDEFGKVFRDVSADGWYRKERTQGFITPPDDSEVRKWRFSKSSYADYLNCRYRVKFRTAENYQDETLYMGTLIHAYAEFRMHYPEKISEKGTFYYRDLIYGLYSQVSDPNLKEFDLRMIYQMIENINRFQDSVAEDMRERNLERKGPEDRGDNEIISLEGLDEYKGEFTEIEYPMVQDSELNGYMHGFLDLVIGDDVWDYKTGKQKDASDFVKDMFNYNDFQPYFYLLMMLDDLQRNGRTDVLPSFNLFYPKEYRGSKKAVAGGKMIHFMIVDSILDHLQDENGSFRRLFEERFRDNEDTKMVYFAHWAEIIESLGGLFNDGSGPFTDIPKYDAKKVKNDMKRVVNGVVNEDLTEEYIKMLKLKEVHSLLNKVISHGMYIEEDTVYVPRSILSSFYEKVRNDHRELFERIADDTLDKDLIRPKCDKCGYRDICTVCGGDTDE